MRIIIFIILSIAAGLSPLLSNDDVPAQKASSWPVQFDGKILTPLPAAAADRFFQNGFPGHVARFSDGRRQIVLRQVNKATRKLHPARDCFQSLGYSIDNAAMIRTENDGTRSCFDATKDGKILRICEQITDSQGGAYPEVAAWYWPALTGQSQGPWLAATIVETIRDQGAGNSS